MGERDRERERKRETERKRHGERGGEMERERERERELRSRHGNGAQNHTTAPQATDSLFISHSGEGCSPSRLPPSLIGTALCSAALKILKRGGEHKSARRRVNTVPAHSVAAATGRHVSLSSWILHDWPASQSFLYGSLFSSLLLFSSHLISSHLVLSHLFPSHLFSSHSSSPLCSCG